MEYSYDSLLEHWRQHSSKTSEWVKKGKAWLTILPSGDLRLAWKDKWHSIHTKLDVRSDGIFECWRKSNRIKRSSICLAEVFGHPVKFELRYPPVLGIELEAYNLRRLLLDAAGQQYYPLELYEFRCGNKTITYKELTAALGLQVLHYCRIQGHPQPRQLYVCCRRRKLQIYPRRYRKLVKVLEDGLFKRVSLASRLNEKESLCWTFPDLTAIEAELENLAGDLGRPSTWHLPSGRIGLLPSLEALDFSRFPRLLPKRLGSELCTQVQENRVQIFCSTWGVLLAEIYRDRSLVLWDTKSDFARKVHMALNPRIARAAYYMGKICYAKVPSVALYGPVFDGCRVDAEGLCLEPIGWKLELSPTQAALQVRQILFAWLNDNVAVLAESMSAGEGIGLRFTVEIGKDDVEFVHYEPIGSLVLAKDQLELRINEWCTHPPLVEGELWVDFSFYAHSIHDLLLLDEANHE